LVDSIVEQWNSHRLAFCELSFNELTWCHDFGHAVLDYTKNSSLITSSSSSSSRRGALVASSKSPVKYRLPVAQVDTRALDWSCITFPEAPTEINHDDNTDRENKESMVVNDNTNDDNNRVLSSPTRSLPTGSDMIVKQQTKDLSSSSSSSSIYIPNAIRAFSSFTSIERCIIAPELLTLVAHRGHALLRVTPGAECSLQMMDVKNPSRLRFSSGSVTHGERQSVHATFAHYGSAWDYINTLPNGSRLWTSSLVMIKQDSRWYPMVTSFQPSPDESLDKQTSFEPSFYFWNYLDCHKLLGINPNYYDPAPLQSVLAILSQLSTIVYLHFTPHHRGTPKIAKVLYWLRVLFRPQDKPVANDGCQRLRPLVQQYGDELAHWFCDSIDVAKRDRSSFVEAMTQLAFTRTPGTQDSKTDEKKGYGHLFAKPLLLDRLKDIKLCS
jgi:hypothetical protein